MIKIGIPQRKIYKLTIAAFIWSFLTFNLYKGIEQSMKLLLICQKSQKPLNLGDYKTYINNSRETSIPASEKKSLIDADSLQLAISICAATIFEQALIDLLKL